jgi:hypothetical protein
MSGHAIAIQVTTKGSPRMTNNYRETQTTPQVPDVLKAGAGLALAAGVGAGVMYFFDPNRGRARRAMVLDKAAKLYHDGVERAEHTIRDLENRAGGLVHEADALLHAEPIDDEILVAHVRAKLGRLVARPHRVEATAKDGHVALAGQVRPEEAASLLLAVRAMRGVKEVENRLEIVVKANETKRPLPRIIAELAALAGVSTLLLSKSR